MIEDLNSGKIMYAFLKINDPKTSLSKYVLINWQGAGANTVRKGICANHLRDVANFFTGAHCTINARNEEEVDPQLIIDKVSKSGSAYSFKAPRSDNTDVRPNIGSNYQKVNPVKEINARERDQFWLKEEQEEKNRIEEEKNRKALEKAKMEEELKRREILEAAERENKTSVRNNNIDQVKKAEVEAVVAKKPEYVEENVPQVNQSDVLRQQRNKEAQELIAQRTINARSIFEQNTSAGQIIKRTPEKPVRNSLNKQNAQNKTPILQQNNQQEEEPIVNQAVSVKFEEQQQQQPPTSDEDDSDQFSTIKRSPKDQNSQETAKKTEIPPPPATATAKTEVTAPEGTNGRAFTQPITDQQFVDEIIYQDFAEDVGLQARALYDYQAGIFN